MEDPEFLIQNCICIRREVFLSTCMLFINNVQQKNKNLYQRAADFSKDFNEYFPDSNKIVLTEDSFETFCSSVFDFMNYIRKIDEKLYAESILHVRKTLSFPFVPTLDTMINKHLFAFDSFLEERENGKLNHYDDKDDDKDDDDDDDFYN